MRRAICLLVWTSFVLAQEPDLGALKQRILAIASECEGIGLHVTTLRGQEVASVNADEELIPASNVKIVTAALAMEVLGPDFELRTTLHRRGSLRGGRLHGDLVAVGNGDPTLSSRFRGDGADGLLREWSRQLAGMGIQEVLGDLVLDTRLFEGETRHPSWPKDQWQKWYSAGVSALNLGDGCLQVTVRRQGDEVRVEVDPALLDLEIDVDCRLTEDKSAHRLAIALSEDGSRLSVSGEFWRGAGPFVHDLAVGDPVGFFGRALVTALAAEGIAVRGAMRSAGPNEPRDRLPLLCASTTPLRVALGVLLKRSQNLYAEALFKLCGARTGHKGSFEGGAATAQAFVKALGYPMTIVDGSGLSRLNRISPRALTGLLGWISQRPWAEDFYAFLPVSGVDGTLARRLQGAARGRVLAKTGTLNGVSALSGFAIRDDLTLVFSILINQPRMGTAEARRLQDRIVESLFD